MHADLSNMEFFERTGKYLFALQMLKEAASHFVSGTSSGAAARAQQMRWLEGGPACVTADLVFDLVSQAMRLDGSDALRERFVEALADPARASAIIQALTQAQGGLEERLGESSFEAVSRIFAGGPSEASSLSSPLRAEAATDADAPEVVAQRQRG